MTVTTARRSEIVRALQKLRSEPALSRHHDALTDAILLVEGEGIPFDEIDKLPAARRSDPDTSHEFVLTVGDAHRRYLTAYAVGAETFTGVWITNLTPDEAAMAAGDEPGPGPRKRISELKRAGLLADSGKRRSSALGRPQQVLTITEHGCNEAKKLGVIS
jgi:hypothetical protein